MKSYFIFLLLFYTGVQCHAQQMKGISIVGPFLENNETALNEINDLGSNWVSLSP